jgi:hypothetical protein
VLSCATDLMIIPSRDSAETFRLLVGATGLEPVTSCVSSRHSNQAELRAPKGCKKRI